MSLRPQLVVYIRACIHVFGRCLQMYQLPEDDDDIFDEVNTSKRLNTSRYTLHALCFLLVISCNALLFYRSIGGTDNEHSVSYANDNDYSVNMHFNESWHDDSNKRAPNYSQNLNSAEKKPSRRHSSTPMKTPTKVRYSPGIVA